LKDSEGLEAETKSNLEREARELAPQVLQLIEILPLNRERVYDRLHLARSLAPLNRELSQKQLETALAEARELADQRAQAYAMGELGWMKQQQGNWTEAEQWTRQAVAITPPDAIDIRYQWEWQLGQILKAEGRTESAIRHYTEAVDLLQRVRQNLVAIAAGMGEMNADLQFDFRDRVEPVYRELVGLLLDSQGNEVTHQDHIQTALGVIELLQVAELENFLQCDLQPEPQVRLARTVAEAKQKVSEKLELIFQKDPNYALIYPMILPEKLEVVLALAGQPLIHDSIPQSESTVKNKIKDLKLKLVDRREYQEREKISYEIYQWLIQPYKSKLRGKSLIFIVDTPFQTIPMSALYDEPNKQYLIETNPVSLVSSLQLLKNSSNSHRQLLSQVLTAGLSEGRTERNIPFSNLDHVEQEITNVKQYFSRFQQFFEKTFTPSNLETSIQTSNFSIVHLATHGNFSSQRYLTFVLAGQGILELSDFNRLFKDNSDLSTNPIELLVLSACQTAKGDRKSALGIAGVTVTSRINNTLASLWSVNDKSTTILMTNFYQKLTEIYTSSPESNYTFAQALQEAQKIMITEKNRRGLGHHPYHWSPFILVQNSL
ncbi:MAG: CHAT domain-containing protein, partial [Planktothrix sp.]